MHRGAAPDRPAAAAIGPQAPPVAAMGIHMVPLPAAAATIIRRLPVAAAVTIILRPLPAAAVTTIRRLPAAAAVITGRQAALPAVGTRIRIFDSDFR